MSWTRFLTTSLSSVGKNTQVRGGVDFLKKGAKGTVAVGGYGVMAAHGYYSYGKDYGAGAGVLMGLGEAALMEVGGRVAMRALMHPVGWLIAGTIGAGYLTYKQARKMQPRRRLNMGRRMHDNYGTLNQMRMQSIRSLARDRSGATRVLGNEARMLHR